MVLQPGVRRRPTTIHGAKTECFSTVVDTEHTEVIHFEDLINRDRPVKRHSTRRPGPRPAADFRQNEAWQRAYASRELARGRQKPQTLQEKPCINVRAFSGHRPVRNSDRAGYDARPPHTAMLQDYRRNAYVQDQESGEYPIDDMQVAYSFLPEASPPVPQRSPQRLPTPTPEQQVNACAQSGDAGPQLSKNAWGSSVPPPVLGSPGIRSRVPQDMNGTSMKGLTTSCGSRADATSCRGGPGTEMHSLDKGSPPAPEYPLREMQRLLGETWRYQQLSTAATASAGTGRRSPLRFSTGSDIASCPPPPICSDLLEVCTASGPSGDGEKPAAQESPEYVFLGRLVATLPDEKVADSNQVACPSRPQAVVECNFWQLRDALGGVVPNSVPPELSASAPAHDPLATVQSLRQPLARIDGLSALGSVERDCKNLPPWPHEM
jgi:hypothetical protein